MKKALLVISVLALMVALFGCTTMDLAAEQNAESIETRAQMFDRAQAAVPEPRPDNFLAREMLAKYVERQDTPDHPFFIYVLGETGNVVGYYVAQAAPVNINAFLSSTQDIRSPYSGGNVVLDAPSLDGIFYGGSGSSSGADAYFFFDAATDALVVLYGVHMFVSDQPLNLNVSPIEVLPLPK